MRIGIVGAGAVGSFFGALLHRADHQVVFLARGKHLEAMRKNGLIVKREEGTFTLYSTFTDDPKNLANAELILFCVKSNDTENMAKQLLPILSKDTKVITLQNGIDNEERLGEIFGFQRIFSCATYVQTAIEEPGVVNQQGRVALVIGELDHSAREKCSEIVTCFNQAGIDATYTGNIFEKKWRKLLWNITFNPLSAISTATVGDILDNKPLRTTAESVCKEAMEVAIKVGIPIDTDQTMSTIFKNAERARIHQTSMLQDRMSGKQMEVESVCGYVMRKAQELEISVPTIQATYSILTYLNKHQSLRPNQELAK
ncbi:ketopantoate reductase family protein [Oceanobacillus bengalensis]|uniref:2-dehydropantoate 2-reductase n=1 Tax=Oceanobacillus bengalensis TaxID=1435466 RepID=A0A494YWY9_9BACI|nr:2-dehydropantoate 2-reductase [Oceanobacillus bengalensis]RKQ14741.1 2-dehydropantoate 2-reductase [Oceanobacillus bengalensis]